MVLVSQTICRQPFERVQQIFHGVFEITKNIEHERYCEKQ